MRAVCRVGLVALTIATTSTAFAAPALAELGVGERSARPRPPGLDASDPWSSTPATIAHAHALPPLPTASRLDEADPWLGVTPAPAAQPRQSHEALREAIEHAIEAGDDIGAAGLMETLDAAR